MENNNLSRNVIFKNFIWRYMERFGAQFLTFVTQIVLARLLDPELYGTLALLMVIINFLQIFVDSGMNFALIQKKEIDDTDYSSAMIFNFVMSVMVYFLLFFLAPWIADYYGDITLIEVIRVLGLSLIILGIKNVQQAYVARNLLFKNFFFSTIGSKIISGVAGIWMAYAGYGIWALVIQTLLNYTTEMLIIGLRIKWRPELVFSMERLKPMFSYGWKLFVTSFMDATFSNLKQLIIGKRFSATDLAYYNRGDQIPNYIVYNVSSSIDNVIFSVMSKQQEDRMALRNMLRRTIKTSLFILAPLMVGMFCIAPSFVGLLLTDKWLPTVPYLRIFSLTYLFYPLHTANLSVIKSLGRSDVFLKQELVKFVIASIVLSIAIRFGPLAIALGTILDCGYSFVINAWPNGKLIQYPFYAQVKDVLPELTMAILMGAVVFTFNWFDLGYIGKLIVQILVGAIVYLMLSIAFKVESFRYLMDIIKKEKNKH